MEAYWKPYEGERVDRSYLLNHLIGWGSFGGVFHADQFIEKKRIRSVALKLIWLDPAETEAEADAKLDELIFATTLHHPNLLVCHTAGSAEVGPSKTKFLYLVMELAESSLKSRLKSELLSVEEAQELVEHVGAGLGFLHKSFVHRDIKPDNILRVQGVWKLSDFGLIRKVNPEISAYTAQPAGSLSYMPPESFDGRYTSAFDIWSLGVLLAEALTGIRPFTGATEAALIGAIMAAQPKLAWKELRPFDRMVEGCLTRDYKARWSSDQVLTELKRIRGGPFQSLNEVTRSRYLLLGVLMPEMVATLPILHSLWRTSEVAVRATAEQLSQLSLVNRDGEGVYLDERQLEEVRRQWPDQAAMGLIQEAVRLSAHVILRDPCQFASQVVGRLLMHRENGVVRQFTDHVGSAAPKPWLRPLNAALCGPGTALVRILEGHAGSVFSVGVSADGARAVSASSDKTLKVWDLETGRAPRTLEGHTGEVWSVAVSPDGQRAVSASSDKTLKVWDLETGREIRTLSGHGHWVVSAAMMGDAKRAVSASWDKTLKVWDLESGSELRTLTGHSGVVFAVAVTADGKRAVSASNDKTLKLWDVESGRELRTFRGHTGGVRGVALTGDGRFAVSASEDYSLKLWDLATGRDLYTLTGHSNRVVGVAVSADGYLAVSASWDNTLRLWDLENGKELQTLEGHAGWVVGVAVNGEAQRAVSASWDSTLRVWDLRAGRGGAVSRAHAGVVHGVAVSRDGQCAISASWDNTVRVWDVESGQELRAMQGHSGTVAGVALSADGRRGISASYDGTLRVWDIEEGRELRRLEGHTHEVAAVAISANGQRAISASYDKTLKVWNAETGKELQTLTGHTREVSCVALSENAQRAVSGAEDNTLKLWDVNTGRELGTLKGHSAAVNGVAMTPDGRRAVSVSDDKTVRLWDLETKQELRILAGHMGAVYGVALGGNGRLAVSASEDKTLWVWDLETGKAVATFTCDSAASSCAFAKERIVAGDFGGHLYFLALEREK